MMLNIDSALELRPHGITVNAYAPGSIITPMCASFFCLLFPCINSSSSDIFSFSSGSMKLWLRQTESKSRLMRFLSNLKRWVLMGFFFVMKQVNSCDSIILTHSLFTLFFRSNVGCRLPCVHPLCKARGYSEYRIVSRETRSELHNWYVLASLYCYSWVHNLTMRFYYDHDYDYEQRCIYLTKTNSPNAFCWWRRDPFLILIWSFFKWTCTIVFQLGRGLR